MLRPPRAKPAGDALPSVSECPGEARRATGSGWTARVGDTSSGATLGPLGSAMGRTACTPPGAAEVEPAAAVGPGRGPACQDWAMGDSRVLEGRVDTRPCPAGTWSTHRSLGDVLADLCLVAALAAWALDVDRTTAITTADTMMKPPTAPTTMTMVCLDMVVEEPGAAATGGRDGEAEGNTVL